MQIADLSAGSAVDAGTLEDLATGEVASGQDYPDDAAANGDAGHAGDVGVWEYVQVNQPPPGDECFSDDEGGYVGYPLIVKQRKQ